MIGFSLKYSLNLNFNADYKLLSDFRTAYKKDRAGKTGQVATELHFSGEDIKVHHFMSVRRFDTSSQMLCDELDPYKNITYITVGYLDIVFSSIAGVSKFFPNKGQKSGLRATSQT